MKAARIRNRIAAAAAVAALLGLAGPAALAQSGYEREEIPERLEELPSRVEGALRALIDRMKPALEDAFDLIDVIEQIDSPAHYEKPVILPNGDVLIRRSPDAPDWRPEPEERRTPPRPRHLDPNEGTPI